MSYIDQPRATFLFSLRHGPGSRTMPSTLQIILARSENRRPMKQKAPKKKRGK